MSLLGNEGIELLLGDDTISIEISSLDHFLQNIIISKFSEILGNFSQILEGDESWIRWELPVFCESKVMKTLWT